MDYTLVSYLIILHQALGPQEFPSKGVKVLYFAFKSAIHFELICVEGMSFPLRCFLPVNIQLLLYFLIKDNLFSFQLPLHLCENKIRWIYL